MAAAFPAAIAAVLNRNRQHAVCPCLQVCGCYGALRALIISEGITDMDVLCRLINQSIDNMAKRITSLPVNRGGARFGKARQLMNQAIDEDLFTNRPVDECVPTNATITKSSSYGATTSGSTPKRLRGIENCIFGLEVVDEIGRTFNNDYYGPGRPSARAKMSNGVDISDLTRWYSEEAFSKVTYEVRQDVWKAKHERNNKRGVSALQQSEPRDRRSPMRCAKMFGKRNTNETINVVYRHYSSPNHEKLRQILELRNCQRQVVRMESFSVPGRIALIV
eukprot:scaffold41375_cov36-Attheya_sp.AAC.1